MPLKSAREPCRMSACLGAYASTCALNAAVAPARRLCGQAIKMQLHLRAVAEHCTEELFVVREPAVK
jgi:hypothetical protein